MSVAVTIEERVVALELEVAELKRQLGARDPRDWIERISGSMKDYPEFGEVLRLGRELRQADQSESDE